MAEIKRGRFTEFYLSPSEQMQGQVLSSLQRMVIQNLVAEAATLKSNLALDPEHPLPYIQEEASLAGQIKILEFMLDCSDVAESSLRDQALQSAD